ncbi:DUF1801 domain-containing protein [Ornithinibacillus bavariensis]|uniref:YdhG-like domain-containing protein n=1 Tax=Ornithinibacillus bavariensis TaxID=545502 RepID=A0A919XC08_9BACI|nr:DUF1801 domain-containing protein [Ornithinibacillus bavariensis]GIO27890.1 hypothetical protein J43TS3_25010 [Ornithinibacillus bavariensis]
MAPNNKLTDSEQVVEFMNNLEHPFKEEIIAVRKIILATNNRITEKIKWNAPSFCVNGDDKITFNLRGKGFFRLIFHCGAKVKEVPHRQPLINDEGGLLEWASSDRAILKFTDMNDVISKENYLKEIINKWIDATESYPN